MEKTREIVVIGKNVYEKVNNNNGVWVIPNQNRNQNKKEDETFVDEIGRIQLSQNIMQKINIKSGNKLEVYRSGKNIVLKKLTPKRDISKETSMIIDNKYEVKIQISNLDFNTKHKITTVDEFGKVLIWADIRKETGIMEKDKLKVCVKDDIIILIKKDYNGNNKRRRYSNNNKRRYEKFDKER